VPKLLREKLAQPIGTLLEGTIEENIKKVPLWLSKNLDPINPNYYIICVGDIVSEAFIKSSFLSKKLKMCVIDGKTKRHKYEFQTNEILLNEVKIINAAGEINGQSIKILSQLISRNEKYLVFVDGEEDLLVLPLIDLVPINNVIVYGQPPVTDIKPPIPAGLIIIIVSNDLKKFVNDLIVEFEELNIE